MLLHNAVRTDTSVVHFVLSVTIITKFHNFTTMMDIVVIVMFIGYGVTNSTRRDGHIIVAIPMIRLSG